jgi:hypothetical protein
MIVLIAQKTSKFKFSKKLILDTKKMIFLCNSKIKKKDLFFDRGFGNKKSGRAKNGMLSTYVRVRI